MRCEIAAKISIKNIIKYILLNLSIYYIYCCEILNWDTTIYNIEFYHETLGFIIMDYKIIL